MPIRTIVTTDGSEASRETLRYVIRLAQVLPLEVTLLHALNLDQLEYKMIPDFQVEMIRQGAKRTAERLLEDEARYMRESGVEVQPRLQIGEAATTICEFALRQKSPLLITGRKGHGDLADLLFGSVSNHVVHQCRTPVLVVKREEGVLPVGEGTTPVRALLGMDDSSSSARCMDYLERNRELAKGLTLSVVHVVNPAHPGLEHLPNDARYETLKQMHENGGILVQQAAERLRKLGYAVEPRVEEGRPSKTLARLCSEDRFELAILGRHSRNELMDVLLGPVSHNIVHHCPVHSLIIP